MQPLIRTSCDCIINGNRFCAEKLKSSYVENLRIKFYDYGMPRNDILFDKNANIAAIKEKLHLPKDRKVVLYAPTYRIGKTDDSGIKQMLNLDLSRLLSVLKDKFDGEWCFVFRAHQLVMLELDFNSLTSKYGFEVFDGNIGDDMAEYLACSDVLITDYSSSFFDFALTKRPCFLYAHDLEYYKETRGLYIEIESLPFTFSENSDELNKNIIAFDESDYKKRIDSFLDFLGNFEDGHASERVVEDIQRFLETKTN